MKSRSAAKIKPTKSFSWSVVAVRRPVSSGQNPTTGSDGSGGCCKMDVKVDPALRKAA